MCESSYGTPALQLDYAITWQKLKDVFKVAGRIVNADILTDRDGKSKGLGEVQFEDPSDAIGAIGEIIYKFMILGN